MKVFYRNTNPNIKQMKWCWVHFSMYLGIDFELTLNELEAEILIGDLDSDTIQINDNFWEKLKRHETAPHSVLNSEMFVEFNNGSKDYFSTAFYFINCLWEINSDNIDHLGRSKFKGSVWDLYGFNRPINHVNKIFDELAGTLNLKINKRPSTVFLSHDIDTVYGALFEDGLASIKNKRFLDVFKVVFNNLFFGHQWFNFSKILELEKSFNAKSTFFWITNQEKIEGIGKNADYDVNASKIVKEIKNISNKGSESGLHKSLSNFTFKNELEVLPFTAISNRNHFLKYTWHQLIKDLTNTKIELDASLGYAEVFGYRNGYSMPFYPFELETNEVCPFVELPLTLMDATFSRYNNLTIEEAKKQINNFIEENRYNSYISVLWHNSHFTDFKYKGYQSVYEDILKVCNELKLAYIVPSEIVSNNNLAYNEDGRSSSRVLRR